MSWMLPTTTSQHIMMLKQILPPHPSVHSYHEDPPPFDLTGKDKGITRIEVVRHVTAFYGIIFPMMEQMPWPKWMLTKSKYEQILTALTLHCNGESQANLKRAGHKQIHCWHKSYAVVVAGENECSLVLLPSHWKTCSRLSTLKKYSMIC
jgi:hypothetical protein